MSYTEIQLKTGDADVIDHDATSDFITDAQEFQLDHVWTLHVLLNGVDGSPTLTIEASQDGVNWTSYKSQSKDVDLTDPDNRLIFDKDFPPQYFRVNYKSGGATTGTITYLPIGLKTDR